MVSNAWAMDSSSASRVLAPARRNAVLSHAGEHEAGTGHLEDGKEAQTTHDARAQAISLPDRANDQGLANQLPR